MKVVVVVAVVVAVVSKPTSEGGGHWPVFGSLVYKKHEIKIKKSIPLAQTTRLASFGPIVRLARSQAVRRQRRGQECDGTDPGILVKLFETSTSERGIVVE